MSRVDFELKMAYVPTGRNDMVFVFTDVPLVRIGLVFYVYFTMFVDRVLNCIDLLCKGFLFFIYLADKIFYATG